MFVSWGNRHVLLLHPRRWSLFFIIPQCKLQSDDFLTFLTSFKLQCLCVTATHRGGIQLDLSTRCCITNTLPDTRLLTSHDCLSSITTSILLSPLWPPLSLQTPSCFSPGLNEVVEMHFPWRSLSWRSAHNRTFNPRISHSIPEFLIKHRMVRGNDMESKESSDLNQCHSYASSSNR